MQEMVKYSGSGSGVGSGVASGVASGAETGRESPSGAAAALWLLSGTMVRARSNRALVMNTSARHSRARQTICKIFFISLSSVFL